MHAPTPRPATIRTTFAIAAAEDLELHSVDISAAFTNGDLDEYIYMRQPDGFHEGFFKKKKKKKSGPCAPIYYAVLEHNPQGYTTGYNRVALMVPSNYEVSVAHIAGPSQKEAPTTGALAVGITLCNGRGPASAPTQGFHEGGPHV